MILDTVAGVSLLIIAATWIGYPAAIWALSRVVRARPCGSSAAPAVSVVVATREAAPAIRARVENCLETSLAPDCLEVVVALDRAVDAADYALLSDWGDRVRLVPSPGAGKAAALNAGVAECRHSVLVFADTFQRYDRDTIPALLAGLAEPGVGAVSGSLHIPQSRALLARAYWTYERWLRRNEARVHSTIGATGAVYALRRELWEPLPEGLLLDDVYGPMRVVLAGHRVTFAERARAVELRTSAPRQEYGRKVRTLTGVIQVCAWLPAVLSPRRNPVWAQFIMHKLARMITPYALLGLVVWSAVHGVQAFTSYLLPISAVVAAGTLWAVLGRGPRAGRLRDLVVEGALLQVAVVMAGLNGMRGRWEVWNG